jgi:hypothetical protein
VLGNHGCYPANIYTFGEEAWLTDFIAEKWTKWLPAAAVESLKATGSYSLLHPTLNLRIIVMNTQFCYNFNFPLLSNITDPGEQVEWLISELRLAELASEPVYIVGHIPPGRLDCLAEWSKRYNAIIDRF